MHTKPREPSEVNPAVSPALQALIQKALEKDRDLRYQHASEIRSDLKRLKRDTDSGRSAGVRSAAVSATGAGASRSRIEEEHGQDARATASGTPAGRGGLPALICYVRVYFISLTMAERQTFQTAVFSTFVNKVSTSETVDVIIFTIAGG